MLDPNPETRITLAHVSSHVWIIGADNWDIGRYIHACNAESDQQSSPIPEKQTNRVKEPRPRRNSVNEQNSKKNTKSLKNESKKVQRKRRESSLRIASKSARGSKNAENEHGKIEACKTNQVQELQRNQASHKRSSFGQLLSDLDHKYNHEDFKEKTNTHEYSDHMYHEDQQNELGWITHTQDPIQAFQHNETVPQVTEIDHSGQTKARNKIDFHIHDQEQGPITGSKHQRHEKDIEHLPNIHTQPPKHRNSSIRGSETPNVDEIHERQEHEKMKKYSTSPLRTHAHLQSARTKRDTKSIYEKPDQSLMNNAPIHGWDIEHIGSRDLFQARDKVGSIKQVKSAKPTKRASMHSGRTNHIESMHNRSAKTNHNPGLTQSRSGPSFLAPTLASRQKERGNRNNIDVMRGKTEIASTAQVFTNQENSKGKLYQSCSSFIFLDTVYLFLWMYNIYYCLVMFFIFI